jgi:hypothetical protein
MGYRPGSSGGGSATTVRRNIWQKPSTPHAYDEEFEGPITWASGSDPGWWYTSNDPPAISPSSSHATTAIDKYTAYSSGDMRVHINETHTPSWMRVQPPRDSEWHLLHKEITFPTNMLVYCRFRYTQHIGNTTNDNPRFVLRIDREMHIDSNYIGLEVDSGQTFVRASGMDAGSFSVVGDTTDVDSQGQAIEYFALHKVGDVWHYWAGTESNWIYMGNYTNAYTPTHMSVWLHTHNQDHIISLDFIRFIETDVFPF